MIPFNEVFPIRECLKEGRGKGAGSSLVRPSPALFGCDNLAVRRMVTSL
jgi:hypothetical protein